MRCRIVLFLVTAACAGCTSTQQQPLATTPASEASGAAVARRPLETAAIPAPSTSTPSPSPKFVVPPNVQYVCVIDTKGVRQQTAIEFAPKVADLCRKHPEMGPCQYERNNCRARGGRVFVADGVEITLATEAEYDKKVRRVRFKSD